MVWCPTDVGKAVYDSCLATGPGMALYRRLEAVQAGLVLDGGLHLIACLLPDDPEQLPLRGAIHDWAAWGRLLGRMPERPHM